jgi:hypothetical protein
MTQEISTNNSKNTDYINKDKKYSTPKTAIQKKVRITGLLILFTFLSIFTISFMLVVSEILI